MELLNEKIKSKVSTSKGFLIDGYPREKKQGEEFETSVNICSIIIVFEIYILLYKINLLKMLFFQIKPVDMVLYLESKDETMVQRLLKRAETSGRSDDNLETIQKRLQTFHANNDPIIEAYQAKVVIISAEQSAETVFAEAEKYLDTLVAAT